MLYMVNKDELEIITDPGTEDVTPVEIRCGYEKFESLEDAQHEVNVVEKEFYDEDWNGFCYIEKENDHEYEYWPVNVYEIDENGEIVQEIARLGYVKRY